jgi:hypothetical protein
MHQDPAFQCGETAKVEHRQREPLIGHQCSVCNQCLLVVSTALHGSQDILEVPPYTPALWTRGLGQPHRFKNHQPLRRTPFRKRYPWTQSGSARVFCDHEEWGVWLAGIVGIALDNAIKRGIAVLVAFPSLCISRIELGAIPKLSRA